MKQRLFLAAFAACMAVCGWAQQQTPKSIVCNQDGTVTFTYKNDHAKEVLVGVYNPLIARGKVKDKMADKSKGNVGEFKAKAKHKLKLVPLEGNWDGAVEDEYFDDESPRYLAVEVNE